MLQKGLGEPLIVVPVPSPSPGYDFLCHFDRRFRFAVRPAGCVSDKMTNLHPKSNSFSRSSSRRAIRVEYVGNGRSGEKVSHTTAVLEIVFESFLFQRARNLAADGAKRCFHQRSPGQ